MPSSRLKPLLQRAVGLLALLTAGTAYAADWQRLEGLADGNEHSFDASKLQFELDEVTYWRRVRFSSPVTTPKGRVALALFRERANCRAHTVQALNWLLYDPDGRLIEQADGAETEPRPIVPDTIGEAFSGRLCPLRPPEVTVPLPQDNSQPGTTNKPGGTKLPSAPVKPTPPTVVPAQPATLPLTPIPDTNTMIVIPGNGEPQP